MVEYAQAIKLTKKQRESHKFHQQQILYNATEIIIKTEYNIRMKLICHYIKNLRT